jgi:tetratricopeptide (TPR) repeat protein
MNKTSKSARRGSLFLRSLQRSRCGWEIILVILVLLVEPTILAATPQDSKGLLPPVGIDRSHRVAAIRTSLASGDLAGAQTASDRLTSLEPTNYEGYFWRGFVELQRGNGYDAVRFLRHAEALDANAYVLKLLAVAYYTLRQFHLFTLEMNEAMRTQPEDFAPYYYLGRYCVSDEVSDWDKAAEYFQRATHRNPKHFRSFYYLGYCYEAKSRWAEAERQYRQAIELAAATGSKFALPYEGLARLRLLENRAADALQFAQRAVELAPNDAGGHEVLAKAYVGVGRRVEAIPEWERAAVLDPTNASPYYHLYQIYKALGEKGNATSAYAEFKKLSSWY